MVMIYASTVGIIVCVLYYILRPADDGHLKLWWSHGGFFAFFIGSAASVMSIVALLSLSSYTYAFFSLPYIPFEYLPELYHNGTQIVSTDPAAVSSGMEVFCQDLNK
jgi:hypothetical protein